MTASTASCARTNSSQNGCDSTGSNGSCGTSASGGVSQSASRSAWIKELEDRIQERHRALVEPLLKTKLSTWSISNMRGKTVRRSSNGSDVRMITETDVFPTSKFTDVDWHKHSGSVWVDDSWDQYMSTIVLRGQEVPDWIYGYISHTNLSCLPENGTADECKEGILRVMEESAASVVRKVAAALEKYDIKIITVEVDLLGEHIVIHAWTSKPVMQVNGIMGNKVIRQAVPSRAKICVNTHVEQSRRTDDYLKNKPERQEISREFYYEGGTIVRAEPEHWSAGQVYEPGDIIRIGSIAARVEENKNSPWHDIAFDGDPIAGRDDPRRVQAGTPFQPGERAYWNARRNR